MKHWTFARNALVGLFIFFSATVMASAETFSFLGPSGGPGGNYFSDYQTGGLQVTEVRVRSGAYIDAVQFVYKNGAGEEIVGQLHGGNGGVLSVFKLQQGEHITRITGKHGDFVDSFQLVTNYGRTKGWGGAGGSSHYTYSAPPGSSIYGLFGRSGVYVDAVGVILYTK
jgi:hypothetical protein